jgi:hypothetical protein
MSQRSGVNVAQTLYIVQYLADMRTRYAITSVHFRETHLRKTARRTREPVKLSDKSRSHRPFASLGYRAAAFPDHYEQGPRRNPETPPHPLKKASCDWSARRSKVTCRDAEGPACHRQCLLRPRVRRSPHREKADD